MAAGAVTAGEIDPDGWDLDGVKALVAQLHQQHQAGENIACHMTTLEMARHLKLVRIIVPQHPLWSINPYTRCDFRCGYCSVWAQGAAAPVLVGDAFRRRLRQELEVVPWGHHTVLSSMCDAYVPLEGHLGLARIAIEELLAAGRCVHVVTKGTLVLRDADLLRQAPCRKVEVSLCTLDARLAAVLEPGTAPPAERLALIPALAARGLDVGVSLGPWIPGVTDVAAVLAAVGPERRITISPLKCNARGARLRLAGRTYTQQLVNRLYAAERDRFRGCRSLKWEQPWRFGDHYLSRYRPMEFEDADGLIRSPEPGRGAGRRFLEWCAAHHAWRPAGRLHLALYRASRGRVGRRIGRTYFLLLTTSGRRSGQPRTVPLAYAEHRAGWVVVAINGGADHDPSWLLNLLADRSATVQVGGTRTPVRARVISGADRLRLGRMLEKTVPFYRRLAAITPRDVPVIVLERR